MIEIKNVAKTYGSGESAVKALKGESLNVGGGDFAALLGASGSGKSTLLHIASRLEHPDSGAVKYGDTEKALEMLTTYAEIATNNPFAPTKDSFFRYVEGLTERLTDLPRDARTIDKSMIEAVEDNPAFSALVDNPRFRSIVEKLKSNLGGMAK